MRKRKGITLIELIISVAILGIISVGILGIFDQSLINILRAGKRTEIVLSAKEELDVDLSNNGLGIDTDIEVTLPGNNTVTITGKVIEVNKSDDKGNDVTLIRFENNSVVGTIKREDSDVIPDSFFEIYYTKHEDVL